MPTPRIDPTRLASARRERHLVWATRSVLVAGLLAVAGYGFAGGSGTGASGHQGGGTSTTLPLSPTTTSTPAATTTTVASAGPVTAKTVRVLVLNGSGVPHIASMTAAALKKLGFHIDGVGDAKSLSNTENLIEYAPGHRAAAEVLAAVITGDTTVAVRKGLHKNNVELVLGATFKGVGGT